MESNLRLDGRRLPIIHRSKSAKYVPRRSSLVAGLLLLGLALAIAAPLAMAAPPVAKPLGCLIEPDRIADVGSQVVGLVERIDVERGQMVTKNQLLLQLRADVERANASVAATRAKVDSDVLAAQASPRLISDDMDKFLADKGLLNRIFG